MTANPTIAARSPSRPAWRTEFERIVRLSAAAHARRAERTAAEAPEPRLEAA